MAGFEAGIEREHILGFSDADGGWFSEAMPDAQQEDPEVLLSAGEPGAGVDDCEPGDAGTDEPDDEGRGDNAPDNFDPSDSPVFGRLLGISGGDIPPEATDSLRNANASLQNIEDGRGNYVFDRYEITVDQMPPGMSPDFLLSSMAADLNGTVGNADFDRMSTFSRRDSSSPEVGNIYDIDILGFDNGSVMLTERADDHFVFSTIRTEESGSHPEFGSREFGFTNNPDGSTTFYTSGASRPRDVMVDLFGDAPQERTWNSLMEGLSNRIEEQQGEVRPGIQSERHELTSPDPTSQFVETDPMHDKDGACPTTPAEAPTRFDYRVLYLGTDPETGLQEIAGMTDDAGRFQVALPGDVSYQIFLYNPATNLYGTATGHTGPENGSADLGTVHVVLPDYTGGDIIRFILGSPLDTVSTQAFDDGVAADASGGAAHSEALIFSSVGNGDPLLDGGPGSFEAAQQVALQTNEASWSVFYA
jgi:hypothetical protein